MTSPNVDKTARESAAEEVRAAARTLMNSDISKYREWDEPMRRDAASAILYCYCANAHLLKPNAPSAAFTKETQDWGPTAHELKSVCNPISNVYCWVQEYSNGSAPLYYCGGIEGDHDQLSPCIHCPSVSGHLPGLTGALLSLTGNQTKTANPGKINAWQAVIETETALNLLETAAGHMAACNPDLPLACASLLIANAAYRTVCALSRTVSGAESDAYLRTMSTREIAITEKLCQALGGGSHQTMATHNDAAVCQRETATHNGQNDYVCYQPTPDMEGKHRDHHAGPCPQCPWRSGPTLPTKLDHLIRAAALAHKHPRRMLSIHHQRQRVQDGFPDRQ